MDVPARQAFLIEMVDDRNDLGNAIALNSSMFNGARLLGPAVAGLILGAFHGSTGWPGRRHLLSDRRHQLLGRDHRAVADECEGRGRQRQRAADLARNERRIPIFVPFGADSRDSAFAGPVSIFGAPFNVLMPAFAKRTLDGNAGTYGLLLAVSGGGALLGRPLSGFAQHGDRLGARDRDFCAACSPCR